MGTFKVERTFNRKTKKYKTCAKEIFINALYGI